jgi:hypothetical protein
MEGLDGYQHTVLSFPHYVAYMLLQALALLSACKSEVPIGKPCHPGPRELTAFNGALYYLASDRAMG